MGKNYYVKFLDRCQMCNQERTRLHIGKSSDGWCFQLHVIPEMQIGSLWDWVTVWSQPSAYIEDEMGKHVLAGEMLKVILVRGFPGAPPPSEEWQKDNSAQNGPRGMARTLYDGTRCMGHAEGHEDAPYDLVAGDFK